MSVIDIVAIVITVALAACALAVYLRLKAKVDEGEGFCSINERGSQGDLDDGDVVAEVSEAD